MVQCERVGLPCQAGGTRKGADKEESHTQPQGESREVQLIPGQPQRALRHSQSLLDEVDAWIDFSSFPQNSLLYLNFFGLDGL